MFTGHIVGEVTDTGTTQTNPLGALYKDSAGRVWRYVKNGEASAAFAQGKIVGAKAATADFHCILATTSMPADRIKGSGGVAQHAIAAGSYGWVQCWGLGEILAGTETIDVNEGVYVSATDAGTGMEEGTAVTAAGSTITAAHLAGPIAHATENAAATALATCFIQCL